MGICVDLYSYNKEKLVCDIFEVCKIERNIKNEEILDFILNSFGNTIETMIGGKYIILNNEHWDDGNCFFTVSNVIQKVFNVPKEIDIFLDCFLKDGKELISYQEEYDIYEKIEKKFGVKINDDED